MLRILPHRDFLSCPLHTTPLINLPSRNLEGERAPETQANVYKQMFITECLMMGKVPPNLNVQQIRKGYLKYVFKKGFFADITNGVWRDFNHREMFKTQSEKSKIHKVCSVCMTY